MARLTARTVRDGSIAGSLLALSLACATGTMDEVEDDSGGSSGSGVGAGAPNASGGGAGASNGSGGTGQAGSPATGGAGGGQVTTGGTGGATGGVGGGAGGVGAGGISGSGSTGGAIGTGGGQSGAPGTGGSLGSGGAGSAGGAAGGLGKGGSGSAGGGTGGGSAGKSGTAGAGATAGMGSAGAPSTGSCAAWPAANGSQSVSSTIQVSGTYDGQLKRFSGSGPLGSGGQQENQQPLFEVANGGTLKNVIIGNPASDGVHCSGSCTLENVWWEDVGEDAATFRGSSSSQQMTVRCGGAKNAMDKIFQHNGAGTLTIENFEVDGFSKLYRSCGNCSSQYARHVVLRDLTARSGSTLVGVNTNYGDSATFERITIYGNITICERYTGNSNGGEPVRTGSGPDSEYCLYQDSDITKL